MIGAEPGARRARKVEGRPPTRLAMVDSERGT